MTEAQKKDLEKALWGIANDLRGKMDADEFRDYILGFIFYKYLSERIAIYANGILEPDGILFTEIEEGTVESDEMLEAVRSEAIDELGYFLKPSELFASLAERGGRKGNNFILDDLTRILENIQKSTMGSESEEDFNHLFEDMDLGSTKLGRSVSDRNDLIAKILTHLSKLDFHLHDVNSDLLGDAYEYLIGKFASGAGKKAGGILHTPAGIHDPGAHRDGGKSALAKCIRPHMRFGVAAAPRGARSGPAKCRRLLWTGAQPYYLQPRADEHDPARRPLPQVQLEAGRHARAPAARWEIRSRRG